MVEGDFTIYEGFKLIVTIVKKGMASRVVAASKKAGAHGGTIFLGRGTAKKSIYLDLLGINFDPEKEIGLTCVEEDKVDDVLLAIMDEVKLDKPGNGIGFVINIRGLTGVFHMLKMQQQPG